MARYYPAQIHRDEYSADTVVAYSAVETYTEAQGINADRLARGVYPPLGITEPYWRPTVLLDLGSIDLSDGNQLHRLLRSDPLLAAIYKLGRRQERRAH